MVLAILLEKNLKYYLINISITKNINMKFIKLSEFVTKNDLKFKGRYIFKSSYYKKSREDNCRYFIQYLFNRFLDSGKVRK